MIIHLSYNHLTKQRNLAAEIISRSVNVYDAVAKYADIFRYEDLHSSFINNLKDAVIHYHKMDSAYLSIDKNSIDIGDPNLTVFIQFELLSEHITRGIVDVYVEMLQHAAVFYETFLSCLLQEVERGTISRTDEFIKKIRVAMHFCKDSVLDLRNDKMNLVRIAENQPVGLNTSFVFRLNVIRLKIRQHYKDMQKHFHDENIHSVYDFVMNACEKGYSLHRIKDRDVLAKVAEEIGRETSYLRTLNGLKIVDNGVFPKETTWIYY